MPPENGKQTRDVLRIDFDAMFAQSCKRFLHVDGVALNSASAAAVIAAVGWMLSGG